MLNYQFDWIFDQKKCFDAVACCLGMSFKIARGIITPTRETDLVSVLALS